MRQNVYLSPLLISLTITLPYTLQAAKAIDLDNESFNTIHQQFNVKFSEKKLLKQDFSSESLLFIKKNIDKKNHMMHIRMAQHYYGFPVIGGYAIVHTPYPLSQNLTADKKTTLNGIIYKEIEKDIGLPNDALIQNKTKALKLFKQQFPKGSITQEKITPVVYIDDNAKAHWAYQVSITIEYPDKMPEKPSAIIDAKDFKAFVQWNDLKTGKTSEKGMGYGGNIKVGKVTYGKDYPFLEIKRSAELGMCYMENDQVKVIDMRDEYDTNQSPLLVRKSMAFKCKDDKKNEGYFWTGYDGDGYDKVNSAYSPSNDALYSGTIIKELYKDWYDLEVLSRYGKPMKLVMRVHYGHNYENAYWDGEQMTFGDGHLMVYPLVSLGIAAHEISHGFTEQHADLAYYSQSGGMNESFSDMAAQAADFYSQGHNDWRIGAEIMKPSSGYEALRYMDKPSRDGSSIDSADEYTPGLDVHYSSGVYNRLFYLIATSKDWDTRKAFDVMVTANMHYWTPYATFKSGACGVLKAAKDLKYPIDAIEKALDEVAIDYSSCNL